MNGVPDHNPITGKTRSATQMIEDDYQSSRKVIAGWDNAELIARVRDKYFCGTPFTEALVDRLERLQVHLAHDEALRKSSDKQLETQSEGCCIDLIGLLREDIRVFKNTITSKDEIIKEMGRELAQMKGVVKKMNIGEL